MKSLGVQHWVHDVSYREAMERLAGQPTINIEGLVGGYIGQGTSVQTVTRSYNQYLNLQVLGSQTAASEMASYQAQISQIDNLLGDPTAGLSPALAAFFKGVADASANPTWWQDASR